MQTRALDIHKMNWTALGATVMGASHKRKNQPNQDYIDWVSLEDGYYTIMALSDGHGSRVHIRSHLGSKLAVECALEELRLFVEQNKEVEDLSLLQKKSYEQLPNKITKRWMDKVEEYHYLNPFCHQEIKEIISIKGENFEDISKTPFLFYGATLLAVMACNRYIIYFQIGDGDIITVYENDEIQRPIVSDKTFLANETSSLCQQKPWLEFKVGFQTIDERRPSLIMLSTDGYSNSFIDEDNFIKAAKDIYNIIVDEGIESVNNELKQWLDITSSLGSGDDISLGIIVDSNYISLAV